MHVKESWTNEQKPRNNDFLSYRGLVLYLGIQYFHTYEEKWYWKMQWKKKHLLDLLAFRERENAQTLTKQPILKMFIF